MHRNLDYPFGYSPIPSATAKRYLEGSSSKGMLV
jgi:hypothetical protein